VSYLFVYLFIYNFYFLFILGTSMSGMNSDRVFTTVSKKAVKQFAEEKEISLEPREGKVFGGVAIGVQCTQHDAIATLKIFAKIDRVMTMLMSKLHFSMPECQPAALCVSAISRRQVAEHQFLIPYDSRTGMYDASLLTMGSTLTLIDLTPGQQVRLTSGPFKGDTGEVMYISGQGMYQIQFDHEINKTTKVKLYADAHMFIMSFYYLYTYMLINQYHANITNTNAITNTITILSPIQVRKLFMRPLGWWWIQGAVEGSIDAFPVVNV
jgi:hypothetical protein